MEYDALARASAVVYAKETLPEGVTPEFYLIRKLYAVSRFKTALWCFHDNSVNYEIGFVLYAKDGALTLSSNFIAVVDSKADGSLETLQLGREDLRGARQLLRHALSEDIYDGSRPTTQMTKGASRISRALYTIQVARSQSDVAMKIGLYCTALEALFGTSQAELAHQLSERVACFLEDDRDKRLAMYKAVKAAYGFRSKVVHGDVIRNSQLAELVKASVNCDSLLRRALVKMLHSSELVRIFTGGPEGLDEYLLSRIFGGKGATEP